MTNFQFPISKVLLVVIVVFGVFVAGSVLAANASDLQPADNPGSKTFYEPVVIDSTLNVNKAGYFPAGVHIGKTTGEGGVTYFNGTIVNASVNDAPVTIGDDLRVDGKIVRYLNGKLAPVKVGTDLYLEGSITGKNDTITLDDDVTVSSGHTLTLTGVTLEGVGDLTVDSLTSGNISLTGNATQAATAYGLVKAFAYVNSAGTSTARTFSSLNTTEAIAVTHPATGQYKVDFQADVSKRYFQITPIGTSPVIVSGNFSDSDNQVIEVYITKNDGTAVDNAFMISIY